MERCRWCQSEIDPLNCSGKRKGTLFCNQEHREKFYYETRKSKKPPVIKKNKEIIRKKCLGCNLEIEVLGKSLKKFCSYDCCRRYHSRNKVGGEIITDIKTFVQKLKNKNYWADMADIFELIHFHSLAYPQKSYDNQHDDLNREEVFNLMLLDLIEFINKNEKKMTFLT